jgi:hypothetical protein
LRHYLKIAEENQRFAGWAPPTPSELRQLVSAPAQRIARNTKDLLETVMETLDEIQADLAGMNSVAPLLWNENGRAKAPLWRPKPEDALSDFVAHELRVRLAGRRLVINREVEVSRRGHGIGDRTDVLVQATRRESPDTLSVVVEAKGCWNRELFTAMEAQLVEDYMTTVQTDYGVYLVGWFPKDQWDAHDRRRSHAPDMAKELVSERLSSQAAQLLASRQVDVRVAVVDFQRPQSRRQSHSESTGARPEDTGI